MRIALACVIVGLVHYAFTFAVGLATFFACYGSEGPACDVAGAAVKIIGFPMFTLLYPDSVEGRAWGILNSAAFALCAVGLAWASGFARSRPFAA